MLKDLIKNSNYNCITSNKRIYHRIMKLTLLIYAVYVMHAFMIQGSAIFNNSNYLW